VGQAPAGLLEGEVHVPSFLLHSFLILKKIILFLLQKWIVTFVLGNHEEGKYQTVQSEKEVFIFNFLKLEYNCFKMLH